MPMRLRPIVSCALSLILSAILPGTASASEAQALIGALAAGGKAIMMRHAQTEEAEPAVAMRLSGDCGEEQNLSDVGRVQAKSIAKAFAELGIAVDKVYTSEYCRARETASLAFGEAEPWSALNLVEAQDQAELAFVMADVEERMGEHEGPGTLVLVTHRSNINTLVFVQTEPGDLVVLAPDGGGRVEVLGVLPVAALDGN